MHKGGKYTQLKTTDTWDLQHSKMIQVFYCKIVEHKHEI